jgi:hypothetical protein
VGWLVALVSVVVTVVGGVLLWPVMSRPGPRSTFSVGDRVRVVSAIGKSSFFDGRNGTIESSWLRWSWMVRLDGSRGTVRIGESALRHLPMTEYPDAKKPPAT